MAYNTNQIRNAVLLGHTGSGKTTLAETMLYESGAIHRRGSIENENTISDYHRSEKNKGNSLFSSLMHVTWKDVKINMIDTPGLDDFIGEVISSIKVADTAVMVLNAVEGIEVSNEIQWEYILENQTPTIFVINHMDNPNADFEQTITEAKKRFGSQVLEVQFPYKPKEGFSHIVDALRMVMYTFDDNGGKPKKSEIPAEVLERAKTIHNNLVELAAENEEGLMEKFFENGTLTEKELTQGLKIAIGNQSFFPVFCVSALENKGSGRVMGFIRDICPSPIHRPAKRLKSGDRLACDKDGPTAIFIYKTLLENQVGNVSYFKVYSGVLNEGNELQNKSNDQTERFSQLYLANGKTRQEVNKLIAGDLGVALKLHNSHTGDTLTDKDVNLEIAPMKFPPSKMRLAVKAVSNKNIEKLGKALHTIEEEDPTVRVENNQELNQTIIHGQGQLHFDIIRDHINRLYGLEIEFERARIPYRETITQKAQAEYRHKKQSGGSGQFAEISLMVEPFTAGMPYPSDYNIKRDDITDLPWGGKLSILWCIVGGTIDSKYFNAIKKGILSVMENGPLTGSSCQDIRVSIYDGKMHSVDSNDMAFQLAAAHAFKEAFNNAKPRLLEPLYNLEVQCKNEAIGEVMSDLQSRRAMILGIEADNKYQKIVAKVPVPELFGYAGTLRSITQGKAKFRRERDGFQIMSHEDQESLLKNINN